MLGKAHLLSHAPLAKLFQHLFLGSSQKPPACAALSPKPQPALQGCQPMSLSSASTGKALGACAGAVCPSLHAQCHVTVLLKSTLCQTALKVYFCSSKYLFKSLLLICTAFPAPSFPSLFIAGRPSAYCSS